MMSSETELLRRRLLSAASPEPTSGCWLWTKSVGNSGYGKLRIGNRDVGAHRASFAAFNGAIPDGACVLHSCDVRACINPQHLFIGSHSDNSKDMVRKGRHKCPARTKTSCPKGHEYTGVNSQGRRICHQCSNEASKRWSRKYRSQS